MIKREKILTLLISVIIIIVSIGFILNRKKLETKLETNQILSNIYKKNEKKKNEKIFSTKLKDNRLKIILEELSPDKTAIAILILNDKELVNFINNGDINSYIENKDYDKAIKNAKVIKNIEELSLLSPELGKYFRENLIKNNFDTFIKIIENRPEVIKIKSRITKLLPVKNSEVTFKELSEAKLIQISEILSKSPLTIEFAEKKDLKKYNLEEVVEISKTLYSIGLVSPLLAIEIGDMLKGLDIRKASLYGDLYVKDEKFEKQIKKEYEKGNFTFDNPFLKYNPYGRTPLAYGMKYGKNEKVDLLRVTVLGMGGMPNFVYEKKYFPGELFPIVGLYPKVENTILLEELEPTSKKILKTKKIKLKTDSVDDRLPSIYIEKRIVNSIQPGFNLVSYNLEKEGIPFAFDSMGNIRYILKTGKEMRKVRVEKQDYGVWEVKNDEDEFQLNILGKILGRIGKEEEDLIAQNKKTKYLVRNNNILTVVSYISGAYPSALFSEYGLDSKDEIFKAIIFYDKDSAKENLIEDGERVILYEGDSEN
ncbi:MAG: hypothetical protein ACRC5W_07205 [Cetobacterium sp.]|uniref:hypothetical protein n=1 Tax=Cetobacterium sp. TaxID=2071632 RepID=UPI003F359C6F